MHHPSTVKRVPIYRDVASRFGILILGARIVIRDSVLRRILGLAAADNPPPLLKPGAYKTTEQRSDGVPVVYNYTVHM